MQTGYAERRKMKKKLLVIVSALIVTAMLASGLPCVKADISSVTWIEPAYRGWDDFFERSVIAYLIGDEAKAMVTVYNHLGQKAYVSVAIQMDWIAENYTATESNYPIDPYQSHTFEVIVPISTTVNTFVVHSYTIFVSYYDKSFGGTLIDFEDETYTDFAVYSQDQKDAQDYKEEIDTWQNAYSTISMAAMWYSTKFKEYWAKAAVEESLGDESYSKGDFAAAKDHYERALNYTRQAIEGDIETSTKIETILLDIGGSVKDLLLFQGWAYLLVGIGFLLMGIGVVVYLVRRSGHKASPATSP